jgi:hypothetical protein
MGGDTSSILKTKKPLPPLFPDVVAYFFSRQIGGADCGGLLIPA